MTEFATIEDLAKLKLERYKEISRKFEEYLNTVPQEYREAVVRDYLNKLVEHGWVMKEDVENLHYNTEYTGYTYISIQ